LSGAIGGGIVVAAASNHLKMDRKLVACGGVGAGLLVGHVTKGLVRDVAHGVAAASACIAVYDFVSEFLDDRKKKSAPNAEPKARNEQAETPPVAETSTPAAPSGADDLTAEELAQLQAIAESLTPEEREILTRVEKQTDPAMAMKLKRMLLRMTSGQAVAFLRQNVLPHAQRSTKS
jgi:hypothetical protein